MPYNLVEKQLIYTGQRIRLEVHHLEDEQGHRIRKEVCVHPGAVVVLPFLDANTIVLIRNLRYTLSQYLLELPAGALEKNEDPMNAAGRELLEETGYLAQRMQPLFNFYTSPGILSEKMYAFAAYDLQKDKQALEPGEQIELQTVPFDEALRMVASGQIHDGKTIATLLFYNTYKQFHVDQK